MMSITADNPARLALVTGARPPASVGPSRDGSGRAAFGHVHSINVRFRSCGPSEDGADGLNGWGLAALSAGIDPMTWNS
jgi:hypothetical protein